MKTAVLILTLTITATYSSVVPIEHEKQLADVTFVTRQKQVLDLYVGVAHDEHFHNEWVDTDLSTQTEHWTDPSVVEKFLRTYKNGLLPKDEPYILSCPRTRKQSIKLFDVFFFAKDFDTFYKAASWAKKHVHPIMFVYTYTIALFHRDDCQSFEIPPMYEIFPNYFVPQAIFHRVYDAKLNGEKQGIFLYNNTGYEYYYHVNMFGGPLDESSPHLEYKVSYFTEDVGLNNFYAFWQLHYPAWMNPTKYHKSYWFKRGEGFYYTFQQLFARYSLERLSNGLPYVETLYWDQPLKTGYNPRVAHLGGKAMLTRPDNLKPEYFNKYYVNKARTYEYRLLEAVDEGMFWYNETSIHINDEDGIDKLGNTVYGAYDKLSKEYYGSYWYTALDALGFLVKTSDDHSYNGGAITLPVTTLSDPVFYNYLTRFLMIFQLHKKNLPSYKQKDLIFPGVTVKDFEVDKLITYFDRFDYEVTNGVPFKDRNEYIDHKYLASQYRLNHKPFTYKITVNSDNAHEGMVRVFLGPKYDSEEHLLTLEQKRLLMVELDRFPVNMVAGENVFERNSKESPVFTSDYEGFRKLYLKMNEATSSQEPHYIKKETTCGFPERLQLPRGWKQGKAFTIYIIMSPFEKKYTGESRDFYTSCGSSQLYDYRPLGYPFDRSIHEKEFEVPNIWHKDVLIYHKGQFDLTP